MGQCRFNRAVKEVHLPSPKRNNRDTQELVRELSDNLAIEQALYVSWPVKHDNTGLLIFESNDVQEHKDLEEHRIAGVHFFGLCPVF
jgi:hypothetical protein